ncbi:hypothetical protein JKP88DRAFT_274690 [Tribonema minus]|uniref:Uncharacterized protein n=1 Tax=Tribonema minus TaxID=303371 RepID=A0A835ZGP8_9STRA|nr:hypothetical protein JKP88DRAFT_274690 [Tribonema minus]
MPATAKPLQFPVLTHALIEHIVTQVGDDVTKAALKTAIDDWTNLALHRYETEFKPLKAAYDTVYKQAKETMTPTKFQKWNSSPSQKAKRSEIEDLRRDRIAYGAHTLKQVVLETGPAIANRDIRFRDTWDCKPVIYRIAKDQTMANNEERRRPTEGGTLLKYKFGPMVAMANEILEDDLYLAVYRRVHFALQLTSERRAEEIVNPEYKYIPHPHDERKVIISSLSKKQPGQIPQLDVPVLLICDRERWFAALEWLRAHMLACPLKSVSKWFQQPTSPFVEFNKVLNDRYKRSFSCHWLRHIYCAYIAAIRGTNFYAENAHELLSHRSMLSSMFYADLECDLDVDKVEVDDSEEEEGARASESDSEGEEEEASASESDTASESESDSEEEEARESESETESASESETAEGSDSEVADPDSDLTVPQTSALVDYESEPEGPPLVDYNSDSDSESEVPAPTRKLSGLMALAAAIDMCESERAAKRPRTA